MLMLLSTLAAAESLTTDTPSARGAYSPEHPVALGTRTALWQAGYSAPGLGGHIKFQPKHKVGVEGFWNSFARPIDSVLRHDHVIGFHLYSPLIGNTRRSLSPTFGSCVDFRYASPIGEKKGQAPTAADIRFGVHAGLMAEAYLWGGFALEASASLFGYWGNDAGVDGWSAVADNRLNFSPVGQFSAGLNYYF